MAERYWGQDWDSQFRNDQTNVYHYPKLESPLANKTTLAAASTVHSSKTQLPPVTDCSNGGGSGSPHGS